LSLFQKEVFRNFLFLPVVRTYNDANEEVDGEESANDHENDEI
jgi:hypothetical protein